MKQDYFYALSRKLKSQLQEEQENYKKSLVEQKEFQHLKNIKQRIKSLNDSLRLIESANKH
jgi:hypothetical protein